MENQRKVAILGSCEREAIVSEEKLYDILLRFKGASLIQLCAQGALFQPTLDVLLQGKIGDEIVVITPFFGYMPYELSVLEGNREEARKTKLPFHPTLEYLLRVTRCVEYSHLRLETTVSTFSPEEKLFTGISEVFVLCLGQVDATISKYLFAALCLGVKEISFYLSSTLSNEENHKWNKLRVLLSSICKFPIHWAD